MTQQSAVLSIAFLAGIVVAAVLLGTATRKILPRTAMGIAALAIPIWVLYFASGQGRSLLGTKGFLSAMPEALWFGLTFGVFTAAFFPCPRIYLRGRKKASKACLGLGDCRFPHTQFHWVHPLFSVPRASPWALHLLWQAYSRGRSILQPLRILAGFFVSNASQLTITQNGARYET